MSQHGQWNFEVVQVRGRKVDKFGQPYTAVLSISVANGEVHLEGALGLGIQNIQDKNDIESFIKILGYDRYTSSRYKNDKRITKVTKIN